MLSYLQLTSDFSQIYIALQLLEYQIYKNIYNIIYKKVLKDFFLNIKYVLIINH